MATETDKAYVATLMAKLRYAYPASILPEGEGWKLTLATWLPPLCLFPQEVLRRAFELIPGRFPKFPTLGDVVGLANQENAVWLKEKAELSRGRMLESPQSVDRDEALQVFYRVCDELSRQPLGEKVCDENSERLENLIVLMGMVFGIRREVTMGVEAGKHGHRFDWARTTIACLGGYIRDGRGELRRDGPFCFAPIEIVRAIRNVPTQCGRYPTLGQLVELCRGGDASRWGDGYGKSASA